MNREAILHRIDSEYAYPIDKNTLVLRLRVSKNDKFKTVECLFNPAMKFIKTQQVVKMSLKYVDFNFAYYEARIFSEFPSFSYIFKLVDDNDNLLYVSDEGLSTHYDFHLSQVSAFRYAFINDDDIIKVNKKIEGRIFYQIFVDSFNKGSSENKEYVTRSRDSNDLFAFDKVNKTYHPIFLGGDLKGIINKLDYLASLNVGAIYITPIFKAMTNHKYDTLDYYKIDEMFGDLETLKELTEKAHEKNILIFLDLVFNHTSFFNPMFQDVCARGTKSKYFDFYMVNGEKPCRSPLNYMTFSEGWMMPKLNGNSESVKKYCTDVAKFYLKECDVDGYRLDVSNELPHSFWMYFKAELKKEKSDIFLIGECWYNAYSFLNAYEWDSSMNYAVSFTAKEYFVDHLLDTKRFVYKLNNILVRYKEQTNRMLINLLDSHDVARFYNYLRPHKDIYLLAELFLISYVGSPMIYYGDEIFMEGGDDPFNRKGMEWDSANFNSSEFEILKKIYHLRKLDAFKYGDMELEEKDGILIIKRIYSGSKYLIYINNSTEFKTLNTQNLELILSNNFDNPTLKANSFAVFLEK